MSGNVRVYTRYRPRWRVRIAPTVSRPGMTGRVTCSFTAQVYDYSVMLLRASHGVLHTSGAITRALEGAREPTSGTSHDTLTGRREKRLRCLPW